MNRNIEILKKFIGEQNQRIQNDISKQGYKDDSPYRNNPFNIIQGTPQGTPITMKGVSTPLIGMDEYGNKQYMQPGQEYQFPGSYVKETPIAQMGGIGIMYSDRDYAEGGDIEDNKGPGPKKPIYVESKNDPRYRAYQDSLSLYKSNLFIPHGERVFYKQRPFNKQNLKNTVNQFNNKIFTIPSKNNLYGEVNFNSKILPIDYADFDHNPTKNINPPYTTLLYKKPQQPVLIRSNTIPTNNNTQPLSIQQRPTLENIQPMSVGLQDVDNGFETNLNIPTPVQRQPKGYKFRSVEGGNETSGYINSPEELKHYQELQKLYSNGETRNWLGTPNSIEITPQYQMGGKTFPKFNINNYKKKENFNPKKQVIPEVVRENTKVAFRDEKGKQKEANPNTPINYRGSQEAFDNFRKRENIGYTAALLSPLAVEALPATVAAATPYVESAMATQLPGLASIPGATFGNALTSYFATHGLINAIPDSKNLIKNPSWGNVGSLGMDALEVAPIIGPATKVIGEGLNTAGKALGTEEGLLSNTYKINPWAFKPNPEAYYHRSPNLENIVNKETGMLQGFGNSETGKAYSELARPGMGHTVLSDGRVSTLNLRKPANNRLYFAKGTPLDYGRYNSRKLGMTGQGYEGPYLVEAEGIPMGKSVKGRAPGAEPTKVETYAVSKRPISADEVKFYKEHWLQGYKPINIPTTSIENVYPSFKQIINAPENIDAEHLSSLIKKETDWLRSPEYLKRKMSATGRSEASIKKESEDIINHINNTSINYTGTLEDGVSGLYSSGRNPKIQIFNGVADYPFYEGVLDHEIKHAFSETATQGDPIIDYITGKGYKNYPKVNLNKTIGDRITNAIGMNWANLAPEQQVTGRRMMDIIENTQGVKRGSQLDESNVKELIDFVKKDTHNNADVATVMHEFKRKYGTDYPKYLKDFLNKAWIGVPAVVGVGAAATMEEKQYGGMYQKAGTVRDSLAEFKAAIARSKAAGYGNTRNQAMLSTDKRTQMEREADARLSDAELERKARMRKEILAQGRGQFNSAQDFKDANGAIDTHFRLSFNDNIFDDYLNPLAWTGSMANKLGAVPDNINRGNYGEAAIAFAEPLVYSAIGEFTAPYVSKAVNAGKQFANPYVNQTFGLMRNPQEVNALLNNNAILNEVKDISVFTKGKYPTNGKLFNYQNINTAIPKYNPFSNQIMNIKESSIFEKPLAKELHPYISRKGEPFISREEEVFRNAMGPEYRTQKELENTTFFDPQGNIISAPNSTYTPYVEDEYIKAFNNARNKQVTSSLNPFESRNSSIVNFVEEQPLEILNENSVLEAESRYNYPDYDDPHHTDTMMEQAYFDFNPSIKNKSGLSREHILNRINNKELLNNMSDEDFAKTVFTPNGELYKYRSGLETNKIGYNPNTKSILLNDATPLSNEEYSQKFNENIDMLNDIISKHNKTGVEYKVKKLDPNGFLHFYTPQQNINGKIIPEGTTTWGLNIVPGEWSGSVENIPNKDYFASIPGLDMRAATKPVFSDEIIREGSGTYKSLNEYLKQLNLGRVKTGFNHQTPEALKTWEHYINSGKGTGYYHEPGIVHGILYKKGGNINYDKPSWLNS